MKLTINKISRTERTSKSGTKKFISVGLKTTEYGDRWVSGFGDDINKDWKEGDVVEVDVATKGEYLNFKAVEMTGKPSQTASKPSTGTDWDKVNKDKNKDIMRGIAMNKACDLACAGKIEVESIKMTAEKLIKIQEELAGKVGVSTMEIKEPEVNLEEIPF